METNGPFERFRDAASDIAKDVWGRLTPRLRTAVDHAIEVDVIVSGSIRIDFAMKGGASTISVELIKADGERVLLQTSTGVLPNRH